MGRLDDALDEAFGKKKPKMVENAVDRVPNLNPPPLPYVIDDVYKTIVEKGIPKIDMDLDFNSIANSSDFQRFIVFLAKKITPDLFKGVSTRVSATKMKQQFNTKRADYKLVMNELKEKLAVKRKKVDGN